MIVWIILKRAAALGLLCLGGCAENPCVTSAGLQCLTESPIQLKVAEIEILKQYQPPEQAPHVDHWMAVTPLVITEQWARDRFRAVGGGGRAVLVIEDASIVERPATAHSSNPFASPWVKYVGTISVKLEIIDASNQPCGSVQTVVSASHSISESATVRERESIWLTLVEDMITQLDKTLKPQIQQYLPDFTG